MSAHNRKSSKAVVAARARRAQALSPAPLDGPLFPEEQSVQRKEVLLRKLVENAENVILVQDLERRFVYFDGFRVFGIRSADVAGKVPEDFLEVEDAAAMNRIHRRVVKGKKAVSGELDLAWGKRRLTFVYHAYPVRDEKGRITHVGAIAQSITQLRQAEGAYQNLIRHSLQGLMLVQGNRIVMVNRALAKFCGRTESELLRMTVRQTMDLVHPADRARVLGYRRTRRTQSAPNGYDCRIVRKDGGVRWMQVFVLPTEIGGRRAQQVVFMDITDRKRVEEMLRLGRERLEKRVEERTAQLLAANVYLRKALLSRRQAEELLTIQRNIAEAFSAAKNLPEALDRMMSGVMQITGVDGLGVYLVDVNDGHLALVAHRGLSAAFAKEVAYYDADSPRARLVREGWPVYKKGSEQFPVLARQAGTFRTLAVLPILHDGRVIASLNVASCVWDEFSAQARKALEAVAMQVGGMIARFRAQEALHNSEERFRRLLDTVPTVAVAGYAPDGVVHYWNKASEYFFDISKKEAVGRSLLSLVVPRALRPVVRKMIRKAVTTGQAPLASEADWLRKDGTHIPLISSHAVVRIPGQQPELFCFNVDLSERKRVEEALRESESRYRALAENSPDMIYLCDGEGRMLYANEPACRFFRRSALAVFGRLQEELFPPASARQRRELIQAVYRTGAMKVHDSREGLEGNTVWLENRLVPVKNAQDETVAVVGISRDITALKQSEEELQYTHQFEQMILRFSARFINMTPQAVDANIRTALAEIAHFIGVERGLLVRIADDHKTFSISHEWHAKGPPSLKEGFCNVPTTAYPWTVEKIIHGEAVVIHTLADLPAAAEQEYRWCEKQGYQSLIRIPMSGNNRVIGFLGFCAIHHRVTWSATVIRLLQITADIFSSILERKQLEEDRQRLAARLIEVQENERRDICATLHDHLGQLLTLLRLELGSVKPQDAESQTSLAKASERLTEVLSSVRTLATSLRPVILDDLGLAVAIDELADQFRQGMNVSIEYRRDRNLPLLTRAQETCLYRVVQEALTNVVKHACAKKVLIRLSANSRHVILKVQDNGKGFVPQVRVGPRGIGQVSMRERLRQCDGVLKIVSAPGRGTMLLATLPWSVDAKRGDL